MADTLCPTGREWFGGDAGCHCPLGTLPQGDREAHCAPLSLPAPEPPSEVWVPEAPTDPFDGDGNTDIQSTVFTATLFATGAIFLIALLLRLLTPDGFVLRTRYWLSRCDRRFSKRHWFDEGKVNVKRRTELGGVLTIASWTFNIGLAIGVILDYSIGRLVVSDTLTPMTRNDTLSHRSDYELRVRTHGNVVCAQFGGLLISGDSFGLDLLRDTTAFRVRCEDGWDGPVVTADCMGCSDTRTDWYMTVQWNDVAGLPPVLVSGYSWSICANSTELDDDDRDDDDDHQHPGIVSPVDARNPKVHILAQMFKYQSLDSEKVASLAWLRYSSESAGYSTTSGAAEVAGKMGPSFMPTPEDSCSGGRADSCYSLSFAPNETLASLTMVVVTKNDYLLTRTERNRAGVLDLIASLGGTYALSLSLFLFALIQLELRMKFLRYDTALSTQMKLLSGTLAKEGAGAVKPGLESAVGNLIMPTLSLQQEAASVRDSLGSGKIQTVLPHNQGVLPGGDLPALPQEESAAPSPAPLRLSDSAGGGALGGALGGLRRSGGGASGATPGEALLGSKPGFGSQGSLSPKPQGGGAVGDSFRVSNKPPPGLSGRELEAWLLRRQVNELQQQLDLQADMVAARVGELKGILDNLLLPHGDLPKLSHACPLKMDQPVWSQPHICDDGAAHEDKDKPRHACRLCRTARRLRSQGNAGEEGTEGKGGGDNPYTALALAGNAV